jgi:hypothetical protein
MLWFYIGFGLLEAEEQNFTIHPPRRTFEETAVEKDKHPDIVCFDSI